MSIDRYALVSRHNPILTEADVSSPLSVGNGNFAYTADITGMQTLYEEYKRVLPLCTMAQWGWHTEPAGGGRYAYDPDEVEMTEYPYRGRTVRYAVEKKAGNEAVYDWLRQNPHKMNLARIGLVYEGKPITLERISHIRQELKLYEGVLESRFCLDGADCRVTTAIAGEKDVVGFAIRSELLNKGLAVEIAFPYGSADKTGSDWTREDAHTTEIADERENRVTLRRTLDRDVYEVTAVFHGAKMRRAGKHRFLVESAGGRQGGAEIELTVGFARKSPLSPAAAETNAAADSKSSGDARETPAEAGVCLKGADGTGKTPAAAETAAANAAAGSKIAGDAAKTPTAAGTAEAKAAADSKSSGDAWETAAVPAGPCAAADHVTAAEMAGEFPAGMNGTTMRDVLCASRAYFREFWEKGGAIDLHKSRDSRAAELERRIVLSQYLLAIQSAGSVPPAETGLTCNSWYGKAHLEMYFWHEGHLPLWNRTELLERSLGWYLEHLPEARRNAAVNGYRGARWPKMVAADARNSPSNIATLLVWQQPHIIYMLEMAYWNLAGRERADTREFLEKYYPLVEETAEFMADFAVYNQERGVYELLAPLIPAQENHKPMVTKNPAFEVEYWRCTLLMAVKWAARLGRDCPAKWKDVAEHMAPMAARDGCYLAHDNCPDTYGEFAHDHPSMLCSYGVIDSVRTDRETMARSLKRVEEVWDYPSLWGWDFAVMCMTAVRLGDPEYAIKLLLTDTAKNVYVASGNNFQKGRSDLPLYLPGNGSLLLAAALMTAGYPGSGPLPGFPKNGQWEVEYENIDPFPC